MASIDKLQTFSLYSLPFDLDNMRIRGIVRHIKQLNMPISSRNWILLLIQHPRHESRYLHIFVILTTAAGKFNLL